MLKEWSVQGCKRAKHKTYSPVDDYRVILTKSKAFHYFQARRDEIRFAFDPPYFVDKITEEDRVSDSFRHIFLKRYCTKFGQKFRVWSKGFSKRFQKILISVTSCQYFEYYIIYYYTNNFYI